MQRRKEAGGVEVVVGGEVGCLEGWVAGGQRLVRWRAEAGTGRAVPTGWLCCGACVTQGCKLYELLKIYKRKQMLKDAMGVSQAAGLRVAL